MPVDNLRKCTHKGRKKAWFGIRVTSVLLRGQFRQEARLGNVLSTGCVFKPGRNKEITEGTEKTQHILKAVRILVSILEVR